MCPCISACPLFVIAFRMSSWPAPASTQTAFPPVTHPEEAEKDLHLNICIGASKLSTETSLSRISTISNVNVVLPLSHLMSHIYLTLPSSACEPLILIVIIILSPNKASQAWDWENVCEWESPSHCQPPAHRMLELIQVIFLKNRAECFSLGTLLPSQ